MSGRWQRTFEIAVPVERVWQVITDPEEQRRLREPGPDASAAATRDDDPGLEVLEVVPHQKLRYAQHRDDLPERCEFEIVLESAENGCRMTVTRHGFGDGDIADIFSEANALGWEHGFMDLVLYLETGQVPRRHYFGAGPSRMGMAYADTDSGVVVRQVLDGGFAAEVGLQPGDKLVRVGGCGVFRRSDLWTINGLFQPGTELEVEYIRGSELRAGSGKLSSQEIWAVGE